MAKLIRREEMAQGTIILNEIEEPRISKKAKPGQFVILQADETGERIPLTMADTDPEKGTITIIYMVIGKSTAAFKNPPTESITAAMLSGIRATGIDGLPWTRPLRSLQERVMLLARIEAEGGPWPGFSNASLSDSLEEWLSPYIIGRQRLNDIAATDLSLALRNRLTWQQQRRLDELAPTHLTVPSGSRLPIDYSGSPPVLAVRIQEMFGLTTTPHIANGQMPVILHLLSPAGRPPGRPGSRPRRSCECPSRCRALR